jgi:hypothetical protein
MNDVDAVREGRINRLRQALYLLEDHSTDDAQLARIRGALIDVMIGVVLPRTEAAMVEADALLAERRTAHSR